jgi:tetratricopeptide (TPR) repeat protein
VAYERVIGIDSTHGQAYAWLSEIYEDGGDLEGALRLARRAWDLDRSNVELGYEVGALLFKNGEVDEALPLLAWAASSQPWHAGAHYNLGRVLMVLGRIEEGQRHLDATEFLQDVEKEIGQARAAAALYPDDPARWRQVADLLGLVGRREEQQEALTIARAVAERAAAESVAGANR